MTFSGHCFQATRIIAFILFSVRFQHLALAFGSTSKLQGQLEGFETITSNCVSKTNLYPH